MRTEEEVLKDFEKLGYDIIYNGQHYIKLNNNGYMMRISKMTKKYKCYDEYSKLAIPIEIEEHKLLTELFSIWGWL